MMMNSETFKGDPGFCNDCGSILPLLPPTGNVTCYTCKKVFGPEAFGKMEGHFTIHFHTYDPSDLDTSTSEKDQAEGPVVERKCSRCGFDKMSYATIQLRSADEGQTVFFTCLKCKFKENENS